MKNLTIISLSIIAMFTIFSCASNPWGRLPMATSIALVAVNTDADLIKYEKVKEGRKYVVRKMQNQNEIQVGLSEFASFGKGLLNKKGLSTAKDLVKGRIESAAMNDTYLSNFSDGIAERVLSSINASGYQNREWSDMDSWINLAKMKKKTKKITKKANSDVVVTFSGNIGVIKVPDKIKGLGGLIKIDLGSATGGAAYELIGRFTMYFADSESYIGFKNFHVDSGITKRSDKGIPEFSEQDFEKIANELTNKVTSYLKETKLMG